MRRLIVLPAVLTLVGLIAVAGVAVPRLAAQDAAGTPAVNQIELTPGFIAEVFAGVPSDRAPGQTVYLARFIVQPGSEIFPHGHPGTTMLSVDAGSFGWTLVEGTAYVVRGAGTGGTETEEITTPDTEVILEPGDAIYYEDDVVHTAHNPGDEPAVVLGTLVLEAGQPLLMTAEEMAGMEMGATPEP